MATPVKYMAPAGLPAEKETGHARSLIAQALFVPGMAALAVSCLAAAAAPFGTRWGWWRYTDGFAVLHWAACGGLAASALVSASLVLESKRKLTGSLCILLGLLVFGIPWGWQQKLKRHPPIHDITTETRQVPQFKLLRRLRRRAPNGSDYGGPRVAAVQAKAYPDIKPLILAVPPAQAFDRALGAAQRTGWMVVDASIETLTIEATASTFWFGFKDDVVVRVSSVGGGSRIDVRSVSRVGTGDGGTNAGRIRSYLKTIAQQS